MKLNFKKIVRFVVAIIAVSAVLIVVEPLIGKIGTEILKYAFIPLVMLTLED